jgi:hypothetical protein
MGIVSLFYLHYSRAIIGNDGLASKCKVSSGAHLEGILAEIRSPDRMESRTLRKEGREEGRQNRERAKLSSGVGLDTDKCGIMSCKEGL